jgi:hypothetical protein
VEVEVVWMEYKTIIELAYIAGEGKLSPAKKEE